MNPKKFLVKVGVVSAALWFATCCAPLAVAAGVEYSLTPLGANTWRYDYVLNNANPSLSFDELTIFFELPGVTSIDSFVVPVGWDPLTIQADPGIPASGFVDAVHSAGLIPPGSFSGFSAEFHYAPGVTPAAQTFQLIASASFDVIATDLTTKISVAVPEPSTYVLMLSGLVLFGLAARQRHSSPNERARA